MEPRVALIRTHADDVRLSPLIRELDALLHAMDGDELHEKVAPYNRLEPAMPVVLAERGGEPAGCGALRHRDAETGEIKRMFVRPNHRGFGLGRLILAELEAIAREAGHRRTILETVPHLPAAIGLYSSNGYRRIPNFPPYENIAESLCFEKELTPIRMEGPPA